ILSRHAYPCGMTAAHGMEPLEPGTPVPTGPEHSVKFYREDAALVQTVADRVAAALADGAAAVVVATPSHRHAIPTALRDPGFHVDALAAAGIFVGLDAAATLEAFCVDGKPDAARFNAVVGEPIRAAIERVPARRARAFGEMVDILWRGGRAGETVELEELWRDLLARTPIDLLCAYRADGFRAGNDANAFREICGLHEGPLTKLAELEPAELTGAITVLEDRTFSLELEVRRRAAAEAAYRDLLKKERDARDRLARLQQVTAALSKALTPSDIADI